MQGRFDISGMRDDPNFGNILVYLICQFQEVELISKKCDEYHIEKVPRT